MTVFVTEPKRRGNGMLKPQAVSPTYSTGDNLNHLIRTHPDAIYYTDNEAEFFGSTVSVTEQMDVTYDVWERDTLNPESMPRPYRQNVGGYAVAQNWAEEFNKDEAWRGRYQYTAVKVTTTRKFEEI